MVKGTTVQFTKQFQIARYGRTGQVTQVETVISRPYGTRTTLVDITTETGIALQWPLSVVRRDTTTAQ